MDDKRCGSSSSWLASKNEIFLTVVLVLHVPYEALRNWHLNMFIAFNSSEIKYETSSVRINVLIYEAISDVEVSLSLVVQEWKVARYGSLRSRQEEREREHHFAHCNGWQDRRELLVLCKQAGLYCTPAHTSTCSSTVQTPYRMCNPHQFG